MASKLSRALWAMKRKRAWSARHELRPGVFLCAESALTADCVPFEARAHVRVVGASEREYNELTVEQHTEVTRPQLPAALTELYYTSRSFDSLDDDTDPLDILVPKNSDGSFFTFRGVRPTASVGYDDDDFSLVFGAQEPPDLWALDARELRAYVKIDEFAQQGTWQHTPNVFRIATDADESVFERNFGALLGHFVWWIEDAHQTRIPEHVFLPSATPIEHLFVSLCVPDNDGSVKQETLERTLVDAIHHKTMFGDGLYASDWRRRTTSQKINALHAWINSHVHR